MRQSGMRLRRLLLAMLLLGGLNLATATTAAACSCAGPLSATEYLDGATAVFVGDLVRYAAPPSRATMSSADPAIWTFAVSEVFKGAVAATQDVASPVSGASCGLELPHAGRFLVYASAGSGMPGTEVPGEVLYAGLCAGTRALDGLAPPELGAGKAPIPGTRSADVPKPTSAEPAPEPPSADPSAATPPAVASPSSGVDWATVASWSTGGVVLALAGFVFVRRVVEPKESGPGM